ncbi:D-tagatose-bisphosphate aldolase, class II, non-catalytic subunit [Jiella pacifica]|uniref:D-tagatose-bisphosphate aldolase, class II, non-catalytic subunit n=1 Tax=Jiella pacifica TaxID=2696469 RepID=A0A6N9T880_9HYPH|nr:D-tagatose-bisphosphate aldolase, class II, non-catalytic subunit [Jiella pacifica]NDW06445.1 D-tagatose-bisphosphate aldolase, class II, non-catalytic subunit [Jiella pacifica]
MTADILANLPDANRTRGEGIVSICSAHPRVVEAALLEAAEGNWPVLIEATCNQVNQDGGYTGMTPSDFRHFVEAIAGRTGFDTSRIIFGGDHLGPNPWKHLPAEDALRRAEVMVGAYVEAGFSKIHLDTSMGCAGEAAALPDEVTAVRAARLARAAEAAAERCGAVPRYVIGTEVPTPGGATETLSSLQPTPPEAVLQTVEVHRAAFAEAGMAAAFDRAVGLVVQPGVEFGSESVHVYDRAAARSLAASLKTLLQFVFEAHSTDYQPESALAELVGDGFAILKVGPGLTFALREALYGLDAISAALHGVPEDEGLRTAMERLMLADPQNWRGHYHGDEAEMRRQRHYSYSDRIRYYWPHPEAQRAVERLIARFGSQPIPKTLISQYLSWLYRDVRDGNCPAHPQALVTHSIRQVIGQYNRAVSHV